MVSSQCEESHWDTPNLQEVENKGLQTGAAIELSAGTLLSSPTVSGLSGTQWSGLVSSGTRVPSLALCPPLSDILLPQLLERDLKSSIQR